jgi:hypothetical protein
VRTARTTTSPNFSITPAQAHDDTGETKNLAAAQPAKVKMLRHRYDTYLQAAVKPLQLPDKQCPARQPS